MNNPGIALYLYMLVLLAAFLMSPKWGAVRDAITSASKAKLGTTTPAVAATPPSGSVAANGTPPTTLVGAGG